jgi:hypothetical protein
MRHVQFVSNRVSRPGSGVLISVLSVQPSLWFIKESKNTFNDRDTENPEFAQRQIQTNSSVLA